MAVRDFCGNWRRNSDGPRAGHNPSKTLRNEMSEEVLRRTPLYELHKELGARIVPFAGWEMPVQYAGILDETRAVRNGVGLFDISHMGRIYVRGSGAQVLLQKVTSNDASALAPGQAQYSLLTNERGGVLDDII